GGSGAVLEVSGVDGWQEWKQVQDFVDSKPQDHHFVLDAVSGEVALGPGVREPDGALRYYGAVPAKGVRLRLRSFLIGGGRKGNVARNTISVLKSSIPYVARIQNRRAAEGGVDGEDIANAKVRGPIVLRTRDRAVTMEDYEHLAREAAPEVARVRCVTAGDGADAGGVRILVVPAAGSSDGRLRFEQLVPNEETLQRISRRLDGSRVIGTRVLVEPPVYRGVTVVAKLRPRAGANATRLQADALDALYHYFHPVSGGPDRSGWPLGRPGPGGEVDAAPPPALFPQDTFPPGFSSAFDAALAPVFAPLDSLPASLDPWLAPEDFLDWLAGWFGMALDESWSLARRRALVAKAFDFYRMRG